MVLTFLIDCFIIKDIGGIMDFLSSISFEFWIELAVSFFFSFSTIALLIVLRKSNRRKYILSLLPDLIKDANGLLGAKTGPAKLQFVLGKISQLCDLYHLNYDPDFYSGEIDKILYADRSAKEVIDEKACNAEAQRQFVFQPNRKQD